VTAEALGGAVGDREPEAGTAGRAVAGRVYPVETVEDALLVLRGEPDATVTHRQYQAVAVLAQAKLDVTPAGV